MDLFLPFLGVFRSHALLSARNIFVGEQTASATSPESARTYCAPWSDPSLESSDSDRPRSATMTSANKHGANGDTGAEKKEKKDRRMTHVGADISAFRSDESKVRTDRKGTTVKSDDKIDDEMILDCITVKPKPSHSDIDMTSSSPPDDKIDDEMILDCITVKPKPSHSYTDMTSSPPDDKPAAGSPVSTTRRKWAGPIPAYLFDSDTPPAPAEHEPVASSPKKRKLVAPMAGSLFDEIHSPCPTKRRVFRSPPTTNSSFNTPFNTPPRPPIATDNVDPQNDTPTHSPIRLRLTSPKQMAVYKSRLDRAASSWEPEASNKSVEAETPPPKPTNEKTDRPRPSKEGIANKRIQRSENRRGKSRRTSDKTWADLSTVDNKKGLLDTFENQRLATPGRRKQLSECNWVRYRLSALNVLMLGDWAIGPVPRLVLTDPEGRHYELEDARFPTQRGLPDI